MKSSLSLLLAIHSFLLSAVAHGGEILFQCEVLSEYTLGNDGMMKVRPKDYWRSDGKFVVERATGRILGNSINNDRAKEIRIIDKGGAQFIFVMVAHYSGNTHDYLQIMEVNPNIAKPFLLVSRNFEFLTGTCR